MDAAASPVPARGAPMKILKVDGSSYNRQGGGSVHSETRSERKIVFADDKGEPIAENVYVADLHYSTNSYTVSTPKAGCRCVIC